MSGDLLNWLKDQYKEVRVLDDGSIAAVGDLMFTRAIYVGLNRYGYERRFCFKDLQRANAEFEKLKSEFDEPSGYIAQR
jgi:hypothetical protein